jgi:hypothetical protein
LIQYDCQGSQEFGTIQYFLECYNKFYACIHKYKKSNKTFLYDLTAKTSNINRDLANKYLYDLYFIVEETNIDDIICVEQIITKCVLIKINIEGKEILYITKFINEYEHD